MRLLRYFLSALSLTLLVKAQDLPAAAGSKEKHDYQSDVARMRKIVINSLYSHRDVFLRELISNANDALEKLRILSLTDKTMWNGADPLNITIKAIKDEDGPGGRLVISDTGIGMTAEELTANLGTLAKSGTSEFLARAESETSSSGTGNLIGAFGVGFYSSFLVADQVFVASKSSKSDTQFVFSSSSEEGSFDIYPDPRGNTLGRGTEITLILKEDAWTYLEPVEIAKLVAKHSGFSTAFPIYQYEQKQEHVPIEESETEKPVVDQEDKDDDEALVEDQEDEEGAEVKAPLTKTVYVDQWNHLNAAPPLWQRDPKEVTDAEYKLFYQNTFRDFKDPLAWHHFSGDSDDGVAFKAIVYIPSELSQEYWNNPLMSSTRDIRLMVKRVFITSDLGEDAMPKWASWVKVVVDAEDLPLNVSRETLQSTKFLKQLKQVILKRLLQLFLKLQEEDTEKFQALQKAYGHVLKLGAVEDKKNAKKLLPLVRFATNQRSNSSLADYVENKKEGQKQIFYVADSGKSIEDLKGSVFVEKLHARGYEVLLLNHSLDEILVQNLRMYKKLPFQDAAKAGLKFGDEEGGEEEDTAAIIEKYKPLIDWMKKETSESVRDVVISNRLVSSPCAIVAGEGGYTANVERMIAMQNNPDSNEYLTMFAKKQKVLEINPKSPLIEGLLRRVELLPDEEEGKDLESEEELREVISILIDGALVRSGYDVTDSNKFFAQVDRVLRRSLGVLEHAPTDTNVKPAPPVDPTMEEEADDEEPYAPTFELPREVQETEARVAALKARAAQKLAENPDKFQVFSNEGSEEESDEVKAIHDEL